MIEKIVHDLHKVFVFKNTTQIGDIVLIVAEQIMYAMVTGIERDETRKDEWWQVSLQLLILPPQKTIWTMRMPQFTGQEIFTMGGKEQFVKAIDFGWDGGETRKIIDGQTGFGKKKSPFLRVIK